MTTMRLLAEGLSLTESDRSAPFASVNHEPSVPSLPVFADHPIGRDAEPQAVAELIERDDTRLLTLLGPAGVGKTRIAVGYATQPAQFPDGVYWFPIGTLNDPTTVLSALAGALGVRGSPKVTVEEIIDHLRPLSSLLVIDNAEHHLTTCRALLRHPRRAPKLTILITSRHLTGVPGELALPVVPLLCLRRAHLRQLREVPSCQLFLARSLINNRLDQPAADAVIRICHRLDGLPLALELAAARTNVLTVHELADTLESELSILQTPGPGGEQELVDAMVGWTYQRLSATEQLIFERLSVFGGSFSRAAVTEVRSRPG